MAKNRTLKQWLTGFCQATDLTFPLLQRWRKKELKERTLLTILQLKEL